MIEKYFYPNAMRNERNNETIYTKVFFFYTPAKNYHWIYIAVRNIKYYCFIGMVGKSEDGNIKQ